MRSGAAARHRRRALLRPFAASSPTGLWRALHGHDAWPRSLHRVDVEAPPAGLGGWLGAAGRPTASRRCARRGLRLPAAGRRRRRLRRPQPLRRPGRRRRDGRRRRPPATGRRGTVGAACPARRGPRRRARAGRACPDRRRRTAGTGPGPGHRPGAGLRGRPARSAPPADRTGADGPARPLGTADRRAAWRAALPGVRRRGRGAGRPAPARPRDHRPGRARPARSQRLGGRARWTCREIAATIRARAGIDPAGRGRPGHAPGRLGPTGPRRRASAQLATPWPGSSTSRSCWTTGACVDWRGPTAACGCCSPARRGPASRWPPRWSPPRPAPTCWSSTSPRSSPSGSGETEKNLAAVFDVAERTQAVLLLDEADALFGARTEIADAHDRYANLETAYLLAAPGPVRRHGRARHQPAPATSTRRSSGGWTSSSSSRCPTKPSGWQALGQLHLPTAAAGRRRRPGAAGPASTRCPAAGSATPPSRRRSWRPTGDQIVRQEHLVAAMRREYGKASRPFPGEPPPRGGPDHDERAARLLAATAAASGRTEAGR